ncbi:6-phosphogluconolactonase [bacterium]|nr:6-phosphogluconolactonase [bacterium]
MARSGPGAPADGDTLRTEILPDPGDVASRAAERIAQVAREAVAERGRCAMALSGGATPRRAYRALAEEDVPWDRVHLFQVDERAAPSGDPDRNYFHMKEALIDRIGIPAANVHPMPVEGEDLDGGAGRYEAILRRIAGTPPVLDLVQLGLGEDGHTASLFPGDPALQLADTDVAVSGLYKGRRRMTLTYPAIDRARCILWIVTGAGKTVALERLRAGDRSIPAGRVRTDRAVLLADRAASGVG